MEDCIKISCIGLEVKDTTVIKSILKLTAKLSDKFIVIDNDAYQSADLLFVNADNENSLGAWQELKTQKRTITPIMVTSNDTSIGNNVTIRRPMVIRRVVNALETVLYDQLKHDNLTIDSSYLSTLPP